MSFRARITIYISLAVIAAVAAQFIITNKSAKQNIAISINEYAQSQSEANTISAEEKARLTPRENQRRQAATERKRHEILKKTYEGYRKTAMVSMIIICAAGIAAASFLSGQAIKPLSKLNREISDIDENKLDKRLPELKGKDEIALLTNSFNGMLDRLHESFERQKRFSSDAAHELKTPVTVIKTAIQTLDIDDTANIEEYREALAVIARNAERLSGVIDDLMTLANDGSPLPVTEIEICSLIKEMTGDIISGFADKNVTAEYDIPESGVTVNAPDGLSYRLFRNIIQNAVKYNRQDGKIFISVTSGKDVTVKIRDTGIGIPESDINDIWQPFFCVDKSRSRKYGGAGLGLSIVKDIADRIGWTVTVTSELDKGTEFTVFIPEKT